MTKGNSTLPMAKETVKAIDVLADTFDMQEWTVVSMEAILTESMDKEGIQITLQFLRDAKHNVVGFKK